MRRKEIGGGWTMVYGIWDLTSMFLTFCLILESISYDAPSSSAPSHTRDDDDCCSTDNPLTTLPEYPRNIASAAPAVLVVFFASSSIFFAPGTCAARHSIHTASYVFSQPRSCCYAPSTRAFSSAIAHGRRSVNERPPVYNIRLLVRRIRVPRRRRVVWMTGFRRSHTLLHSSSSIRR